MKIEYQYKFLTLNAFYYQKQKYQNSAFNLDPKKKKKKDSKTY